MFISWHGLAMCKLGTKDVTVVTNPYDKSTGLTPLRPSAAVVTLATPEDAAHSNLKSVQGDPFVIDGPGENEVAGVIIQGIPTYHDSKQGQEHGLNLVYTFEVEGVRVCHLGFLGHKLTNKQLEQIGNVDVLLLPVGGATTIDAKTAVAVASQIEARIVVPILYQLPGLKAKLAPLDKFLKEMGATAVEPVGKLSVRKSNLPTDETEVVVLKKT